MSIITSMNAEKPESPIGTKTDKGGPAYTRVFDIYCDSVNDGPKTIFDHPTIPKIGDFYLFGSEVDPNIPLESVSANRAEIINDGSRLLYRWEVRCEYRISQNSGQPPNIPENPLLRPVEISGGGISTSRFTNEDVDGKVIKNSAKEPFTDPFEIPHTEFEIEFTRNEASSPANNSLFYQNKVNATPIWGGAAKTWLCTGVPFSIVYEGIYVYYRVQYRFRYNPKKHVLKPVDNGFNELVGGVLKPILLTDGTRPTEPFKLNGSGAKLGDNSNPVFLSDVEIYETASFQGLGLPNF